MLSTDPEKPEEEGAVLEEGAWFGEQALHGEYKWETDMVAQTDVSCMVLSRAELERAVGPLAEVVARVEAERQEETVRRLARNSHAQFTPTRAPCQILLVVPPPPPTSSLVLLLPHHLYCLCFHQARHNANIELEGLQGSNLESFAFSGIPVVVPPGNCMVLATHQQSGKCYTLRIDSKNFLSAEGAAALLHEEALLQRMETHGPQSIGPRARCLLPTALSRAHLARTHLVVPLSDATLP